MKRKMINSQLGNYSTYMMYIRQFTTLAENVFQYENLPEFIDTAYLNKQLVRRGAIAFFKDEVLGVLALPFINIGTLDVYGRPKRIQVIGQNGYSRYLNPDEYVIMYDNNGRYPLYLDIIQYAERYAMNKRTIDINISQQRTPRIWKTSTDKERSVRDLVNNIDANENVVITYSDINVDDTSLVLAPAPFVADKIDTHNDKEYAEFLRLIGISNLTAQKKERLIKDEVMATQGGTVASRFSRYEPRKKAIDMINKKFGTNIKVSYYDGIPSDNDDIEEESFESSEEVVNNDNR